MTGANAPVPGLPETTRSADETSAPSFAVKRTTYVPGLGNVARVVACDAFAKVTDEGPLTCVHPTSSVPLGSPSSVTTPGNVTEPGIAIAMSGPTSTTGATFAPVALVTFTLTSALVERPAVAVTRSR